MTAAKKYKNYEDALVRLEEITSILESGEQPLDDSIKLYTEGIEIAKFCDTKLAEAEKKISIITEKNKALVEDLFEEEV